MPRGKWKKQVFTNDPKFNFFFIPTDQRKQPEWIRNFSILLRLIIEHISTIVNYNHIYATIPKTPLPLHKDGQEYDISYLAPDGTICLIKFKIIIPKSLSDIIVGGTKRPLSFPPTAPLPTHTRGGEVSPPSATRATPPHIMECTQHNGGDDSHG
jgi:hypothetical protein